LSPGASVPILIQSAGSSYVQHYGAAQHTPVKIPYKLVHIDLKGAPPKLSYLKSLFRTIREAGGNGILLEYEDMFPFRGALNGTAHKFHFTKVRIRIDLLIIYLLFININSIVTIFCKTSLFMVPFQEQIHELLSSAVENDLEVIPLIQTFGHLEFVLKLEKFRHLRELDEYPQEICPSNEVAWNLVTTIIDQVAIGTYIACDLRHFQRSLR
jgi:hexosaminidase